MRWIVRLGWLLVALVLAAALTYVAANAWLESTGGQRALERELTKRTGIPVRLLGEFEIMMFPLLGVKGTKLVIGGPGTDEAFVQSRNYAVALELRSLLAGDLRVESIRLAHGALRLDRVPPSGPRPSGPSGTAPRLPAIGSFTVNDFVLVLPGSPGYELVIGTLAVDGFVEGRDTRFKIEVAKFGRVEGRLRWDSDDASLMLNGNWSELLADALEIRGEMNFASSTGNISMRLPAGPADREQVLGLSAAFEMEDEAVFLDRIELSAGAQSLGGHGCLALGAAPGLRLDLVTESLDLDRLPELPTLVTETDTEGALDATFDIGLRLRAGELRRAGAIARNAELSIGSNWECSLSDVSSGPEESG
jgi:hypothetical protein